MRRHTIYSHDKHKGNEQCKNKRSALIDKFIYEPVRPRAGHQAVHNQNDPKLI